MDAPILLPLQGKAGLVTGGASGIGAACCRAAARAGGHLLIVDRNIDAARALSDDLAGAGAESESHDADVRDPQAVARAVDRCVTRFGTVDFVVAAAGIGHSGTIADGDADRWWQVLDTNVLGVMHTARAAFAHMRTTGGGDFVVIASISGFEVYEGEAIYLASKWAVVGLGQALRHEGLPLNVRVCVMAPGLVDTPLARSNPFGQNMLETSSALTAEDVARAVLFALSRPAHVAVNEIRLRPFGQRL